MKKIFLLIGILAILNGCSKEETQIDTEYPVIDISGADAFPVQCSNLKRGERFIFTAKFSDNQALGSYSLDIHQNFDHHTHSTEVKVCEMEADKAPVKPFLLIKDYTIPVGQREYIATAEIIIPEDIDTGDYHFLIRLTDREGWQTIKGLSIKIVE